MPYEREPIETDGDPNTVYEDTTPHLRTGFMPEQADLTALPSDEADQANGQSNPETR